MKTVIQRVSSASVQTDGSTIGSIGQGLLVLLGIAPGDTQETVRWVCDKIAAMRIFEDDGGRMNLSLRDIGGSVLVVSQFTLFGDCRHGNRPGFTGAAAPATAIPLYEYFLEYLSSLRVHVEHGTFGADMKVSLCNDGPVTILLDR